MRFVIFITTTFWAINFYCHTKLLDRIVATFNDEIITLSEVRRIQSNLKARSSIAKNIYPKQRYTVPKIINKEISIKTIRAHLKELGYIVNDDQVETMINRIQKEFRIARKELLRELSSENISFQEYFELLRASREYNILLNIVIEPLVTITEQQIKNRFFYNNLKNKTLSINYSLISYRIPANRIRKNDLNNFVKALPTYMSRGIIPQKYSTVEKINIGNIKEEDLSKSVKKVLKRTNEGDFSLPLRSGNFYTVYYVNKKNLVESSFYNKKKTQIRQALFQEETQKILTVWLAREKDKHYIKKF